MPNEPPRKRRRPAKACEQCRQRKVRCDLSVPCGPCTRAKSELNCSYRDAAVASDSRTAGEARFDTQSRVQREPLSKVSRPRRIASGGNPSLLTPTTSATEHGAIAATDDLVSAIRNIQDRLHSLEQHVSSPSSGSEETATRRPSLERELRALTARVETVEGQLIRRSNSVDSTASVKEQNSIGLIAPRLRSSAQKVKFMGPTHWCNKMDQVSLARPSLFFYPSVMGYLNNGSAAFYCQGSE